MVSASLEQQKQQQIVQLYYYIKLTFQFPQICLD